MSREVRDWAWGVIPSLRSPEAGLILLYLAERADASGHCFPSREQIAKAVNITERSITRALNFFEDQGWLHREIGKGAGNTSRYKFTFKHGIQETGKGDTENSVNEKPGKGEKATQKTGKGDTENREKATQEAIPPHPPIMNNRHVTAIEPSGGARARAGIPPAAQSQNPATPEAAAFQAQCAAAMDYLLDVYRLPVSVHDREYDSAATAIATCTNPDRMLVALEHFFAENGVPKLNFLGKDFAAWLANKRLTATREGKRAA